LARDFQQAGITEKAVRYLRQAGQRAQRLYANEEAAELFQRALALLEDALWDESRESWQLDMATRLYEGLGDVREWTGEHDEAQAAYGEAVAQVPRADLIWHARLQRKIGNIWRLQGHYNRASQAYDLAEAALEPGSVESSPAWRQEWCREADTDCFGPG
jgi:tetratricopeptide (TPR) repeat protein